MINKKYYLEKAIKITEEFCRGGAAGSPSAILQSVYEKLIELAKDAESER